MFVPNTNMLSETMRPAPSEAAIRWVAGQGGTGLSKMNVIQAQSCLAMHYCSGGTTGEA